MFFRLEKILKGKFFSSVEVEVIVRFLKMAMSEVHEVCTYCVYVHPCFLSGLSKEIFKTTTVSYIDSKDVLKTYLNGAVYRKTLYSVAQSTVTTS